MIQGVAQRWKHVGKLDIEEEGCGQQVKTGSSISLHPHTSSNIPPG